MRTPDQFKIGEWQHYLFDAVSRETGSTWKPKSTMVAAWTRVIKGLIIDNEYTPIDSFVLALALDRIALNWGEHVAISPWEVLAPGRLFYDFTGRPLAFWRAVWFSRYAFTSQEVQYYRYHLTQWEAALIDARGEPGRLPWLRKSRKALNVAEEIIRKRSVNPRATFKLHWIRQRFADE